MQVAAARVVERRAFVVVVSIAPAVLAELIIAEAVLV